MRACWSVAPALEHEENGDTTGTAPPAGVMLGRSSDNTGTEAVVRPQERAIPEPQPPQAT